jgi:PAS domain S-box-containing protein
MSDNDSKNESLSGNGFQKQLNGAEDTLRALIDASNDTAILIDTEGIILALNEKAAAVEKLTRDELIGKNLYGFLPKDLVKERRELAKSIIRNGKQYRYEVERNGKYYDVTVNPIKDSSGKVIRLASFGRDITYQKEMENRLRQSEQRLRSLIEASPDGIAMTNSEGDIVFLNQENLNMLGYESLDEIHSQNITGYDLLASEDQDKIKDISKNLSLGGKVESIEIDLKRKDGSYLPVEVSLAAIPDHKENSEDIVIIARDISHRKLAEQKVLESRRRLARAEKVANLGNWEWHIAENNLIWSDQVYRLFDMEPGNPELTRERFLEMVHPEDRSRMENHIENLLRNGYDEPIIYRILTPKGKIKYLRSVSQANKDDNGNVISIFGIVLDITESQMAEIRLKASEQRFFTLFNSTPVMVAITSLKSGKVVEVNHAFCETIGFSRKEIIGKSTVELGMWANPDDRRRFMEEIMEYGFIRDRYYKIKRRDGEILDANVSVDIIEIESEKHLISVTSDITDQKRNEQEREKLIIELKGALEQIKKLSGFIPICPSCKKIRDLQGFWKELESYIHEHSEAEFTHALCPECTKKLYPDLDLDSLKGSD